MILMSTYSTYVSTEQNQRQLQDSRQNLHMDVAKRFCNQLLSIDSATSICTSTLIHWTRSHKYPISATAQAQTHKAAPLSPNVQVSRELRWSSKSSGYFLLSGSSITAGSTINFMLFSCITPDKRSIRRGGID